MRLRGSLLDLAEQAERRSRLAAVLGRLLLAEPGDDVADLVAAVPALAPLGRPDPDLAADFERLLLREVPVYESVFLGEDGVRGGDVAAAVAAVYARHGFSEADRWRIAGVDHLGLELRFFARLCAEESAAWAEDRPDEAAATVEAERQFLAQHLGRWGQVAAEAVRERAGESPYGILAVAVAEMLADEVERLRPEPDHPGMAPVDVRPPPDRLGPARLAQWLLAPATCGAWLSNDDLASAAWALGIPWRPSDPRRRFREVVEAAVDGDDVPGLLAALGPSIARWRDRHAARELASPGAARRWRAWRRQAEETVELIERLSRQREFAPGIERGPVVVVVQAAGPDERTAAACEVLARLDAPGRRVAVSTDLRPRMADHLAQLVDAGADDVLLAGNRVSAVAFSDGGEAGEREARHLRDADVVVRLVEGSGPVSVTVEPGGDAGLAAEVADLVRLSG